MKMARWTGFVVDIEATGPIPGDYSMIEIGAVILKRGLDSSFYAKLKPISNSKFDKSALASIGTDIETVKKYEDDPEDTMRMFDLWIKSNTLDGTYPMFFSDNNGFDFMFTHWYFIHFIGQDPFGHTSRNIADLFRGLNKNVTANFKKLRDTKHTHNPVDDAMGNAEALIKFVDQFGLEGLNIDG